MAVGDLTATNLGQADVGSAALKALIDGVNLPANTDMIKMVATGSDNRMISVIKIVRATV